MATSRPQLKVFCACKRRSEKNVPAEKIDCNLRIDFEESACKSLKCGILCLRATLTVRADSRALITSQEDKVGSNYELLHLPSG